MLEQPSFALTDRAALRDLIRAHGWITLVSGGDVPVVSHLPVILDPDSDDLTVLGHLARTDAELHKLSRRDAVLIVEGPNGYISPSIYRARPYVPTWNYVVVHLHGRPEPLSVAQTYDVLNNTVDHFEAARDHPWRLAEVAQYARAIASGAAAFRLAPTSVVGKAKLSQDKPPDVVARVIDALEGDADRTPALAVAMREVESQ